MSRAFDSLDDVRQQGASLLGTSVVFSTTPDWFGLVHSNPSGISGRPLYDLFQRCNEGDGSAKAPHSGGIRDHPIIKLCNEVVIGAGGGAFPAPMCNPLTKAALDEFLLGIDDAATGCGPQSYYVTEKSDGLRVLVCSVLSYNFPRWAAVPAADPFGFALPDVCTLEAAWFQLCQEWEGRQRNPPREAAPPPHLESPQLRLSFGTCVLRFPLPAPTGATEGDQAMAEGGGPKDTFLLVQKTAAGDGHAIAVRRSVGPRHFTYLIDRGMRSVFCLLHEYPFMLSHVIMDAELILSVDPADDDTAAAAPAAAHARKPRRAFLALFDLFSYAKLSLPLKAWAPAVCRKEEVVALTRTPLKERFDALEDEVLRPMSAQLAKGGPPVVLFRKEMVRLEALPTLLTHIRRSTAPSSTASADGEKPADDGSSDPVYLYRNLTYNDGLIFTPADFDLVAGSRRDQLKWKWPDKLTVDWHILPLTHPPDQYKVDMYFRRKRAREATLEGPSEYSRALKLLNPHKLTVPRAGCVAECSFRPLQRAWQIERIRSDKSEGNAIITIISVMESLCERLTLSAVLDRLGVLDDPDAARDDDNDDGDDDEDDRAAQALRAAMRTLALDHPIVAAELKASAELKAMQSQSLLAPTAGEAPAAGLPVAVPKAHMSLRLTAQHVGLHCPTELHLQWQAKIAAQRNPIPCNHRSVADCFGLHERCPRIRPSSRLVGELSMALANAGGCYAWSDTVVECFFDAKRGRWGIAAVQPMGNKNQTYGTQVIAHLEAMAAAAAVGAPVLLPPSLTDLTLREDTTAGGDGAEDTADGGDGEEGATDEHYAERTKALKDGESTLLRRFNNWIKSVLLHDTVSQVRADVGSSDRAQVAVAELCCGRGGDLHKWKNTIPGGFLLMLDSCYEAVAEAARRYCSSKGLSTKVVPGKDGFPGVPAYFAVVDCFSDKVLPIAEAALKSRRFDVPSRRFDVVSCQFSMHYAFHSLAVVEQFLANVSQLLRVGGFFVGTTVDDNVLRKRRALHGDEFGNTHYKVSFAKVLSGTGHSDNNAAPDDDDEQPSQAAALPDRASCYGDPYSICFQDAVKGAVEYVVDWEAFTALAQQKFRLRIVETSNFSRYMDDHYASAFGREQWEEFLGAAALRRKGIKCSRPHDSEHAGDDAARGLLSPEELEAAFLYRVFMFQKF